MSEMDDIKRKNSDQLNHMSTEELEELLKAYSKSTENTDMEYVLSILEVIEKQENLNPSGKYIDLDSAWDSFQKNYRPANKEEKSIYDFVEDMEDNTIYPSEIKEPNEKYTIRRARRPIRRKALLRMACVIASVVIVLLSSTIVARALGFDLWNFVAQWTKDTFGFSSTLSYKEVSPTIQEQGNQKNYTSLQEALESYNITTKLAPSWLPDGYIFYDINVNEIPTQTAFHSIYKHDDHEIVIIITSFDKPFDRVYEKDDETVTIYSLNGTEYYIMSNFDQTNIAWHTENYECSISGAFSIDEAKNIIKSIYERDLK
jgi:hypothetical protein